MIPININQFSLEWIRADQKVRLSKTYPEEDAFQQICGDIISAPEFKKVYGIDLALISFQTQGRDGAIDHFGFLDNGETLIIECKKNNSVKNCLEEIEKLKSKLIRNLSNNNAQNTIYKPWFNKNLKAYIFCTSCQPSNASEYGKIEVAVNRMIRQLGTELTQLPHLLKLDIKVYVWQQLKSCMERSAFLMYKWAQPSVDGIEYITDDLDNLKGYRSYLSSNKIPFVSRDDYMSRHPDIVDLPSENEYLNKLINEVDSQFNGLLVFGEGGIGKTRLMKEMALMAIKDGWQVYIINAIVDLKDLITFLRPGGKYILVFDYIEEINQFQEWMDVILPNSCTKSSLS